MGNDFFEFIKKTGIFLICAESILHFAPGNSYQKYIKVLVGIMILAQFMIPVKALLTGQEKAVIEQQIDGFRRIIEEQSADLSLNDLWIGSEGSVEAETIKEIKSRLSDVAAANGYVIDEIEIDSITRVFVRRIADEERGYGIMSEDNADDRDHSVNRGPINIPGIELGQGAPITGGTDPDESINEKAVSAELGKLRQQFCSELGTGEQYLEVVERG